MTHPEDAEQNQKNLLYLNLFVAGILLLIQLPLILQLVQLLFFTGATSNANGALETASTAVDTIAETAKAYRL